MVFSDQIVALEVDDNIAYSHGNAAEILQTKFQYKQTCGHLFFNLLTLMLILTQVLTL